MFVIFKSIWDDEHLFEVAQLSVGMLSQKASLQVGDDV